MFPYSRSILLVHWIVRPLGHPCIRPTAQSSPLVPSLRKGGDVIQSAGPLRQAHTSRCNAFAALLDSFCLRRQWQWQWQWPLPLSIVRMGSEWSGTRKVLYMGYLGGSPFRVFIDNAKKVVLPDCRLFSESEMGLSEGFSCLLPLPAIFA